MRGSLFASMFLTHLKDAIMLFGVLMFFLRTIMNSIFLHRLYILIHTPGKTIVILKASTEKIHL